jgi:hypothetical protein
MTRGFSHGVRLAEVPASGLTASLVADEAARREIARALDLVALDRLEAEVTVKPWFDGAEISGRWQADYVQTCGVTLERLDRRQSGDFTVRAVPPGSLHAPAEEAEAEIDLETDDSPDVAEGGAVDLAAYVVEHLALEIDPFPRKPGAEFTPPENSADLSPFAVLKRLRQED